MSESPKISVIIPVYGVEKYIGRCAVSLFRQTMTDGIEFIFVNDCTKDRSIDILTDTLSKYPARKKSVKIVDHIRNMGLIEARATGLKHAEGEYVIFCDSDDYVDESLYGRMYETAIRESSDIVICDMMMNDGERETPVENRHISDPGELIGELLEKDNGLSSLCTKLIRSDIVKNPAVIKPCAAMNEDRVWTVQCVFYAHSVSYCPGSYYHYCSNPDSMTRTKDKASTVNKTLEAKRNLFIIQDFLNSKNIGERYAKSIIAYKYNIRNYLFNYCHNKDVRAVWKRLFPEINLKTVFLGSTTSKKFDDLLILMNICPINNYLYVCHKNGDKTGNRVFDFLLRAKKIKRKLFNKTYH